MLRAGQVSGDMGAFCVLGAAKPDRHFLLNMDKNALRHIERPAVIAGQPAHVGRVLADDQIEACFLHPPLHVCHAPLEFGGGKSFSNICMKVFPQVMR